MTNRERIHALLRELGYTREEPRASARHGWSCDWCKGGDLCFYEDGDMTDEGFLSNAIDHNTGAQVILTLWAELDAIRDLAGDGLPEPKSRRTMWEKKAPGIFGERETNIILFEYADEDPRYGVMLGGSAKLATNNRAEALAKVRELLGVK